MHALSLLGTLLALGFSANALPANAFALLPRDLPPSNMSDWTWQVTGYQGGCSPAACTWSFSISASQGPDGAPAFATSCYGNDLQNNGSYVPCDLDDSDSRVFAKLGEPSYGPPTGYNMSIVVSYAFKRFMEENTVTFNYTGNGTGPYGPNSPGPVSFAFAPSSAHGYSGN